MRIKTCLKPGQKGTKKWSNLYGNQLVAVRYRYDEKKKRRYKTIEIIVEESDWIPKKTAVSPAKNMNDRFGVRVAGYELALREQVKSAGAIWRPRQKLWELPYSQILALGLEERIVRDQK